MYIYIYIHNNICTIMYIYIPLYIHMINHYIYICIPIHHYIYTYVKLRIVCHQGTQGRRQSRGGSNEPQFIYIYTIIYS